MSYELFFDEVAKMFREIRRNEGEHIRQAAGLIAESIMKGGVVQVFGNGHSYVGASDLLERAGGLVPVKSMGPVEYNPYEKLEGVGTIMMEKVEIRPEDVCLINTHAGRNPLGVEVAMKIKEAGVPLIVVTAYESSMQLTSTHSSGKMVRDFADVILDTKGVYGDAAIQLPGMPTKVGATSTAAAALLIQCTVLEAVELMLSRGFKPPIYRSCNVDGGREANRALVEQYAHRIFHK